MPAKPPVCNVALISTRNTSTARDENFGLMIAKLAPGLISMVRSGGYYVLSQISIFAAPVALIPILTRSLTPEDLDCFVVSDSAGSLGFVLLRNRRCYSEIFFGTKTQWFSHNIFSMRCF